MKNPSTRKQVTALKRAIISLERDRRRNFAAGEAAWQQGVRSDAIKDKKITGKLFTFAEDDHKSYVLLTSHIQELEDLIEIVTDPGGTTGYSELPLFRSTK